jgi:hypothetical protein
MEMKSLINVRKTSKHTSFPLAKRYGKFHKISLTPPPPLSPSH